ncbi:hypothetical protein IAU60_005931 [Kwoniella sp. DSM 27419]
MISGTAMSRNLSDERTLGVKISCNHQKQTYWLPNATSHPEGCEGIALSTFFPSCGTGEATSDDHFSHMAWPVTWSGPNLVKDINGKTCPDTHPIKYPTIFAEFNYYLSEDQPWRNEECLLVLSNGDCTGNSFHVDFVNGWDRSLMQDILKECGLGHGPGDQLDQCEPIRRTKQDPGYQDCRYQNKIPDEEVGYFKPLDKLPGCNPLWKESMGLDKPQCDSEEEDPGFVGPNVLFENLKYRNHIPLAISEIGDTDNPRDFLPAAGFGASHFLRWGTEGNNVDKQTVGTHAQLLANLAGGANVSVPSAAVNSSSTVASSSVASSTSSSTGASVSTAATETATTDTAAAPATATSAGQVLIAPGPTDDASTTDAASATAAEGHDASSTTVAGSLATDEASASASSTTAARTTGTKSTLSVDKPTEGVKTCKKKTRMVPRVNKQGLQHHLERRSRTRAGY